MYKEHFHFAKHPFVNLPNPECFFPGEVAEETRQTLERHLLHGHGIGILIGKAGVGKTLMFHVLRKSLADRFEIVLLNGTALKNSEELFWQLAHAINLSCVHVETAEIRQLVLKSFTDATRSPTLLLIDEAQFIATDIYRDITALAELLHEREGHISTAVRILFAGTPTLEETLTSAALESFNQRITCRCYLEPLRASECRDFLQAAVIAARVSGKEVAESPEELFDAAACREMARLTDGIPRLLNQLADATLQVAAEHHFSQVNEASVRTAWNRIQAFREPEPLQETEEEDHEEFEWCDETVRMTTTSMLAVDFSFENCDAEEFASLDIDCTHDLQTEAPMNQEQETTNKPASETPLHPEYVYKANAPVVLQFPCYIDKNIAMMNWIAPGHRIESGVATPYREKISSHNGRAVPSEPDETTPRGTTVYGDDSRFISNGTSSLSMAFPSLQVPVATAEQENKNAARPIVHANFSTDNHKRPRSIGSTGNGTLEEVFEETETVPVMPIPLRSSSSLPEKLSKPIHELTGNKRNDESAVSEMHRAAERIEKVTERLERLGGEVGTTLQHVENGMVEMQQVIERQQLPTCRELFDEIAKLHEVVSEELAQVDAWHWSHSSNNEPVTTEREQQLRFDPAGRPSKGPLGLVGQVRKQASEEAVGPGLPGACRRASLVRSMVEMPESSPSLRKIVEFRPRGD